MTFLLDPTTYISQNYESKIHNSLNQLELFFTDLVCIFHTKIFYMYVLSFYFMLHYSILHYFMSFYFTLFYNILIYIFYSMLSIIILFYFICTYSDLWWNLWKFGIGCWICWASKIQESCLMIIIDWDFFFVFQDTVYLVLLQVPKCFEVVQIFCARPKIYLHIVAVTNILCQTKKMICIR